eukprot:g74586.t1
MAGLIYSSSATVHRTILFTDCLSSAISREIFEFLLVCDNYFLPAVCSYLGCSLYKSLTFAILRSFIDHIHSTLY